MQYKVKYAFVLDGKTYFPGEIVKDSIFLGKESILNSFLATNFLVKESEPVTKFVPEPVKEYKMPVVKDITNDKELMKAVENPAAKDDGLVAKAEVAPAEPTPPAVDKEADVKVPAPAKQKGKVSRG